MSWQCSIRLVNEEGDPISGIKVHINFSFWTGFDSVRTDDDGWAHFEYESIDKPELYAETIWAALKVFPSIVDLTLAEGVSIENGETMSFTVTDEDWSG
ncbi:MAG TPA: hypothetical protein VN838_26265 [Bradyrhizobium sp.]|nr:hypothetical protein [Bradyrhizobium sp.]